MWSCLSTAIEVEPFPLNSSATKAEIIALIQSLILGKGKRLSIYTDCNYAFFILHARATI